jgi:hypothetical protein
MTAEKISFSGIVLSVQPRIRLLRSFDEVSHQYSGYTLGIHGTLGTEERDFTVGVGKAAHAKLQFRVGDKVSGEGKPVANPGMETADLYKVSKLKILERGQDAPIAPPWHSLAPALEIYRERGHRRLDAKTYQAKCLTCVWGCLMPVEMVIEQWKQDNVKYRREAFCYGPTQCKLYAAGPTRKVPGRNGMSYEEENWVDEQNVSHRRGEEH